MGFAVKSWAAAVAVGLLCGSAAGANPGAPADASQTAPNTAALMARGIQAYYARNNSVALPIFRQVAATGDVDAMMYLGVMYGTGRGVTADYQAALTWFSKAANA